MFVDSATVHNRAPEAYLEAILHRITSIPDTDVARQLPWAQAFSLSGESPFSLRSVTALGRSGML